MVELLAKALQTLNIYYQLKSIGDLISKDFLTTRAKDELEKIKKIQQNFNRGNSIYKISNKKKSKTYGFQRFNRTSFVQKIFYN